MFCRSTYSYNDSGILICELWLIELNAFITRFDNGFFKHYFSNKYLKENF